jgi:hypothetical protein
MYLPRPHLFTRSIISLLTCLHFGGIEAKALADGPPNLPNGSAQQTPPFGSLPSDSGKTDRIQNNIDDAQDTIRIDNKQVSQAKAALTKANNLVSDAQSQIDSFQASHDLDHDKWMPQDRGTFATYNDALKRAQIQAAEANASLDSANDTLSNDKDTLKKLERKLDQVEEAQEKNQNCVECNKDAAKYKSKSGWDTFADVVKAATPLGLGAMNTYAGIKAANLESSDYQLYANSMNNAGLPFSQNTTGYSSIMSSMMSGNNMLSLMSGSGSGMFGSSGFGNMSGTGGMGGGFGMSGGMGGMMGMGGGFGMSGGMGGFGMMGGMGGMMGMGGGFGMTGGFGMSGGMGGFGMMGGMGGMGYGSSYGYSPYSASGYGSYMGGNGSMYPGSYGYSGFGGLSNYNPWSSNFSQYTAGSASSYYGAQLRALEQNSISSQDSLSAQQALSAAESRYQQVLGNVSGTSYSPYTSSYSGYYPYSYGGYGTSTSYRQ